MRWRVELAELERSARVVVLMHVHAVEHERVEVDVEPEGAVRALYGHHRARVGDRHAAEAEAHASLASAASGPPQP